MAKRISMQRDRIVTARLWYSNAETDFSVAGEIAKRNAARSAFHAQQAAEMALEAVLIAIADDHPRMHVGGDLSKELGGLGESVSADVVAATNRLDLPPQSRQVPFLRMRAPASMRRRRALRDRRERIAGDRFLKS